MSIGTVRYVNISFLNVSTLEGQGCTDGCLGRLVVPPEAACWKQSLHGFEARASLNRLSDDRLDQQIGCIWGSTEPISC